MLTGSLHAGCPVLSCLRERDEHWKSLRDTRLLPGDRWPAAVSSWQRTRSIRTQCSVPISFPRPLVMGFVFRKASNMALLFSQQVNNPQGNKRGSALIEAGWKDAPWPPFLSLNTTCLCSPLNSRLDSFLTPFLHESRTCWSLTVLGRASPQHRTSPVTL